MRSLVALVALGLSADAYAAAPPGPPPSVVASFTWTGQIGTETGTRDFSVVPEGRDLNSSTPPYTCLQRPIEYKRVGSGWRASSGVSCAVGSSIVSTVLACYTVSAGGSLPLTDRAAFTLFPDDKHFVALMMYCRPAPRPAVETELPMQ